MYTFGINGDRKQTHLNTYIPGEYMLHGSEPAASGKVNPPKHRPSFTYVNRYIAKRRVMRNIRRLKRELAS